jgi:hypothetical protein
MKVRITENTAIYCDAGPYEGMYRVDLRGSVYLTAEEVEKYSKGRGFDVVINEKE